MKFQKNNHSNSCFHLDAFLYNRYFASFRLGWKTMHPLEGAGLSLTSDSHCVVVWSPSSCSLLPVGLCIPLKFRIYHQLAQSFLRKLNIIFSALFFWSGLELWATLLNTAPRSRLLLRLCFVHLLPGYLQKHICIISAECVQKVQSLLVNFFFPSSILKISTIPKH